MVEQLLQEQQLNSCGVIGTVTEVGEIGCSWTRGWAALVERSLFRTNICKLYVSPNNTYAWCRSELVPCGLNDELDLWRGWVGECRRGNWTKWQRKHLTFSHYSLDANIWYFHIINNIWYFHLHLCLCLATFHVPSFTFPFYFSLSSLEFHIIEFTTCTCGSVLQRFILCFRFFSIVACRRKFFL